MLCPRNLKISRPVQEEAIADHLVKNSQKMSTMTSSIVCLISCDQGSQGRG